MFSLHKVFVFPVQLNAVDNCHKHRLKFHTEVKSEEMNAGRYEAAVAFSVIFAVLALAEAIVIAVLLARLIKGIKVLAVSKLTNI